MIEAIKNSTSINKGTEAIVSTAAAAAQKPEAAESLRPQEQEKVQEAEVQSKKKNEEEQSKVNDGVLADLEQDLKMIHNVELRFSLHEATGRTMVKVVNKDTDKLIREIPQEEVLNLAAKLDEMVGIIFDETV